MKSLSIASVKTELGSTIATKGGKHGVKIKRHSNGKDYAHKIVTENVYNNYK